MNLIPICTAETEQCVDSAHISLGLHLYTKTNLPLLPYAVAALRPPANHCQSHIYTLLSPLSFLKGKSRHMETPFCVSISQLTEFGRTIWALCHYMPSQRHTQFHTISNNIPQTREFVRWEGRYTTYFMSLPWHTATDLRKICDVYLFNFYECKVKTWSPCEKFSSICVW